MNEIFVPTDFSQESRNTIHYAIEIARRLDLGVKVVHILNTMLMSIPGTTQMSPEMPLEMQTLTEDANKSLGRMMEDISRGLKGPGVPLKYNVVEGVPAESIIAFSEDPSIEYIFLTGKREEESFLDLFGQSNYRIMDKSKKPVWVIHPDAKFEDMERIIYATDYHEEDLHSIKELVRLARPFKAKIIALHVTEDLDLEEKIRQKGLKELVQNEVDYPEIDFQVTKGKDIIDYLDQTARDIKGDLIALLKENRGFIEKIFNKSITRKLAARVTLPLLIFHEEKH